MAAAKKDEKTEDTKADSLWRKPITLNSFEDEDPLAALYRGREVGDEAVNTANAPLNSTEIPAKSAGKNSNKSKNSAAAAKPKKTVVKKTPETPKIADENEAESGFSAPSPKVTEEELKNLLKIKSDSFQFSDIREILRGKSFDIYAYLRFLSGGEGFCKIKHLDLMQILDISRPTLFKQGDWLTRLSLIEKSSVPGDHLGTSYTVRRLEDVLPVSETLIEQLQSHIENLGREAD